MIAMVSAVSPSIMASGMPLSHSPLGRKPWPLGVAVPGTWNWPSWARKITMASPLTKPSITGCGTSRMNLPSRNAPASTCRMPISTTVAKRYSTPWLATRATMTTASAPVAPEIMPGRPPSSAVIRPTRKAA